MNQKIQIFRDLAKSVSLLAILIALSAAGCKNDDPTDDPTSNTPQTYKPYRNVEDIDTGCGFYLSSKELFDDLNKLKNVVNSYGMKYSEQPYWKKSKSSKQLEKRLFSGLLGTMDLDSGIQKFHSQFRLLESKAKQLQDLEMHFTKLKQVTNSTDLEKVKAHTLEVEKQVKLLSDELGTEYKTLAKNGAILDNEDYADRTKALPDEAKWNPLNIDEFSENARKSRNLVDTGIEDYKAEMERAPVKVETDIDPVKSPTNVELENKTTPKSNVDDLVDSKVAKSPLMDVEMDKTPKNGELDPKKSGSDFLTPKKIAIGGVVAVGLGAAYFVKSYFDNKRKEEAEENGLELSGCQ